MSTLLVNLGTICKINGYVTLNIGLRMVTGKQKDKFS